MVRTARAAIAAMAFGLALVAGAVAPRAQGEGPVHVLDRPKPEYEPVGGRVGSFFIYPKAELESRYDSNIFATENDTEGDFIGVFSPQILIESDWSQHALNATAGADVGRHAEFDSEDYEDAFAGLDGRLDVLRSTTLFADLNAARLHEDRGSPDDVNGETPTVFYDYDAGLNATHQFSRIALLGDARYRYLDYEDVESSTGATINNDDRDRGIATAGGRVGYEIVPDYLAFLRGEYNNRDYTAELDDGGVNRDSQGYNLGVGTQFRLSGITRGELSVGWQQQFYEDSSLEDFSGYAFRLALTWFATELTTVDVAGARTIEETTIAGASGYASTSLRVAVAHELLRNLVLTGSAGAASNDYQGIGRLDYLFEGTLGAKYLINRNFYLGAGYEFRMRESDEGSDYLRSIVMVRAGAQF